MLCVGTLEPVGDTAEVIPLPSEITPASVEVTDRPISSEINKNEVAQKAVASVPPAAAKLKFPLTLMLDQIQAMDLVDTGSFLDPQDPSLTITFGPETHSTARYIFILNSFNVMY